MPKRRADWLSGRIAAKCAVVAALADAVPGDWPVGAIEIPSDDRGVPYARVAPEAGPLAGFAPAERLPVTVTISHAEGYALCAAAWLGNERDGSHQTLGIDLGAVEPRSREFVDTFFTEDEQRFVRDGPRQDGDLRANLVWCAKEAVLKALGLGLTVDTLELSCVPDTGRADPAEWRLDPAGGSWHPFTAACSAALLPDGGAIGGVWRAFPGFVGALAKKSKGRLR